MLWGRIGESRGIAPSILNLGTKWRWGANSRPRPLTRWKELLYQLTARVGGLQNRSGRFCRRDTAWPYHDSNPGPSRPQLVLTGTKENWMETCDVACFDRHVPVLEEPTASICKDRLSRFLHNVCICVITYFFAPNDAIWSVRFEVLTAMAVVWKWRRVYY